MRNRLVAAAVLLVAALYLVSARRLPVGAFNDDAANVLLSRSLARGSYSFPGGLGAPEEFLPAFPLLLAVPARLVEPRWDLLRAIPLLFAALCLLLTWRLARRFLSVEAAGAAVLLVALNPVWVGLGGLVLPYMPFIALSLALIDGAGASANRRSFLWLAAGAALAPLLRPQGVVLDACLALALWHKQGFRRGCAFLSIALLPVAAWTLRDHLRAGSSRDYVDIWRSQMAVLAHSSLLDRAARFLSVLIGGALLGVTGPAAVQAAFGAAALALALYGAVRLLKKSEDPRVFVLASYAGGLALLHVSWRWIDARYVLPFAPLLWILIVAAAAGPLRKRRVLAGALVAVLAVLSLRLDAAYAARGLEGDAQFQPRTMAWIQGHVPPAARLESARNYTVALLTGRECATQTPFPRGGLWLEQARLEGVDYLHVVLPRPGDEFNVREFPAGYQAAFARWLDTRPEATQVYRDLDEGALVYRLNFRNK